MSHADPSKQRIISVELDEGSIVWRNPDVEQERRVAIFDLIEDNKFVPQRGHPDGYAGPYRLMLRVEEGRLIFEIAREDGSPLEAIILDVFSALTLTEVVERLDRARIANARVNDMHAVWQHEQLAARRRWSSVETPEGRLPALLPPALSETLAALASPKSRTLTTPSSRTLTFAGLRSRWTMPAACAASSASAIARPMRTVS